MSSPTPTTTTDRETYQALSQPPAHDDDVVQFGALASTIEAQLQADLQEAGSELDEALGSDGEEEEATAGELLERGAMHDGEAAEIERLSQAAVRPQRASSVTAAAKIEGFKAQGEVDGDESPGDSGDEEGYCEDDEGEDDEGEVRHYGYEEEVVPEVVPQDREFLAPVDPDAEGLVYDADDEDFVDPEHRADVMRRRPGYLAAMTKLRELLPEGTAIPDSSTITQEHQDFNVLFADEKDYEDFCVVSTRIYHELLLGISTTRKTTAIEKQVHERYKQAEERLNERMLLIGTNIMKRASDHYFGGPEAVFTGDIQGLHPWFPAWSRIRHAVDLRISPQPVEIPADNFCCVTGLRIPKGQECYLVGLVRKQLNDRTSTDLYPTFVFVSLAEDPSPPDAYVRFVQAAFTLWNYRARMLDWMKEWKAENPLGSTQADLGPDNLMGSDRGRAKLGHHYLELKTLAAYCQQLLSKDPAA